MNGRQVLVIATAALCWVAAPACRPAFADSSSPGVDSGAAFGAAFDLAGTIMLNATAVPELRSVGDVTPIDQGLGTNPLWGIPLRVLRRPVTDRSFLSPVADPQWR